MSAGSRSGTCRGSRGSACRSAGRSRPRDRQPRRSPTSSASFMASRCQEDLAGQRQQPRRLRRAASERDERAVRVVEVDRSRFRPTGAGTRPAASAPLAKPAGRRLTRIGHRCEAALQVVEDEARRRPSPSTATIVCSPRGHHERLRPRARPQLRRARRPRGRPRRLEEPCAARARTFARASGTPPAGHLPSSTSTAASTCGEISSRSARAAAASMASDALPERLQPCGAVGQIVRKFFADRGTHLAAMIAYFALMSFVPLVFLALVAVRARAPRQARRATSSGS